MSLKQWVEHTWVVIDVSVQERVEQSFRGCLGHHEHRVVLRVLLHIYKGLFVVVGTHKLNVSNDCVNHLVNRQNVFNPLRLGVEISLLKAYYDLDNLFVRSMDIDILAKERFSQPNVQGSLDNHLRDLFSDRP